MTRVARLDFRANVRRLCRRSCCVCGTSAIAADVECAGCGAVPGQRVAGGLYLFLSNSCLSDSTGMAARRALMQTAASARRSPLPQRPRRRWQRSRRRPRPPLTRLPVTGGQAAATDVANGRGGNPPTLSPTHSGGDPPTPVRNLLLIAPQCGKRRFVQPG